jgi:hypothetical protein
MAATGNFHGTTLPAVKQCCNTADIVTLYSISIWLTVSMAARQVVLQYRSIAIQLKIL